MEYAKTKDIIHVMGVLGHRNIKNTLIYTYLVACDDKFTCRIAQTPNEIVLALLKLDLNMSANMKVATPSKRGNEQ